MQRVQKGYYLSDKKCNKCNDGCAQCKDSASNCLECESGYHLTSDKHCNGGYYDPYMNCLVVDSTSSNNCLKCQSGYALVKSITDPSSSASCQSLLCEHYFIINNE